MHKKFSYSHAQMVLSRGQEKVLKSEHPTKFGKIPKKEKNNAVVFMEKRTNRIL